MFLLTVYFGTSNQEKAKHPGNRPYTDIVENGMKKAKAALPNPPKYNYNIVWALLQKANSRERTRMIGFLWYGTLDIVMAKVLLSKEYDVDSGLFQDVLFAYIQTFCSVGDDAMDEEGREKGERMIEEYSKVMPVDVMYLLNRGTFRLKKALVGAVGQPDNLAKQWKAEETMRQKREMREKLRKNGGVGYDVRQPRTRNNKKENGNVREDMHQRHHVEVEGEQHGEGVHHGEGLGHQKV